MDETWKSWDGIPDSTWAWETWEEPVFFPATSAYHRQVYENITRRESFMLDIYLYIYIHNYIYISSMTPTQPQRTSCYWSVGLHQSPSCEFTQGSSMIRTWMNSWWVIGKVWWTMRILRAGVVWECFLVKVGWLDGFTSPGLIVAIGEEALLGAVADTSIY